jgi:hypothetical protein
LNIDIKRRQEIGSLVFFCAIGGGLLYIPFALLFFSVWHPATIDRTSIVLSIILDGLQRCRWSAQPATRHSFSWGWGKHRSVLSQSLDGSFAWR